MKNTAYTPAKLTGMDTSASSSVKTDAQFSQAKSLRMIRSQTQACTTQKTPK